MSRRAKVWWTNRALVSKRLGAFNSQGRRYNFKERITLDRALDYVKGIDTCQCGCGRPLVAPRVSFDHKYPLADGGSHTLENLQVVRRACNFLKCATDPIFWADFMGYLRRKSRVTWFFQSFRPSPFRRG